MAENDHSKLLQGILSSFYPPSTSCHHSSSFGWPPPSPSGDDVIYEQPLSQGPTRLQFLAFKALARINLPPSFTLHWLLKLISRETFYCYSERNQHEQDKNSWEAVFVCTNVFLAAGVAPEDGPVGWPAPKLHLESFMQKVLSPYTSNVNGLQQWRSDMLHARL